MMILYAFLAAALVPVLSFNVRLLPDQMSNPSRSMVLNALDNDRSSEKIHSTSDVPITSTGRTSFKDSTLLKAFAFTTALCIKSAPAVAASATESTYKDAANGFSLLVEPGWSIMPRKTPTPTMVQFATEEVLFTGSRFNEDGGASSLSVTRTNAVRLLKDFDVEWWFAPLNSMSDLGSADLIAGLLILQRQGEFEKRESPSAVENAKISPDGILTFDFTTPLGSIYVRNTAVKAFFRDKKLMVVWLSALTTFWEGPYGEKLETIRDSFQLINIDKRSTEK